VLSERVQQRYPAMACNLVEGLFTVTNPEPKRGLLSLARAEARRAGLRVRDLAADAWTAVRTFG
jgi:electron transfer flavoprotein-quinone oxidoreductase